MSNETIDKETSLQTLEGSLLASLSLGFSDDNGTTRLTHREHTGPLLVQKPLYPEGERCCHVIVVHPPGGIVGGDRLRLNVNLGERKLCSQLPAPHSGIARSVASRASMLNYTAMRVLQLNGYLKRRLFSIMPMSSWKQMCHCTQTHVSLDVKFCALVVLPLASVFLKVKCVNAMQSMLAVSCCG